MTTPLDAVPRLVALGMALDDATRLAGRYPATRVADVLDAFDRLDADQPMRNPVGWVTAAVTQGWDLAPVLAQRRENELRLVELQREEDQLTTARYGYGARRAIADQWDTAISAALDDKQLSRAVAQLAGPVPGLGRVSVPVVRAELVAWAVAVHQRDQATPLADALDRALDHPSRQDVVPAWPLPHPPDVPATDDVRPLRARLEDSLDGLSLEVDHPVLEHVLEVEA